MLTKSPEHRFFCSCASGHINYWLEGFAYVLSMFLVSRREIIEFCIRESWILSFENLLAVFTMCIIFETTSLLFV